MCVLGGGRLYIIHSKKVITTTFEYPWWGPHTVANWYSDHNVETERIHTTVLSCTCSGDFAHSIA